MNTKREHLVGERGAIFFLLSLLIVVLLGIIAIVVDISLASSSAEQAKHVARFISLGALERYYDVLESVDPVECDSAPEDARCTHECALNCALERAQELAERNRLAVERGSGGDIRVSLTKQPGKVWLRPGVWYTASSVECLGWDGSDPNTRPANCPCELFDGLPCFKSLDEIPQAEPEQPEPVPNAFQARGTFFPALTMRLARSLFGVESIALSANAVSSIIPRRGCFLVDISPSASYESHLRWTRGLPPQDLLPIDNPDGDYADCPPETPVWECDSGPNPAVAHGNNYSYVLIKENVHHNSTYSPMDLGWEWLTEEFPTREEQPVEPLKHFADDYVRMYTFGHTDYPETASAGDALFAVRQRHPDPETEVVVPTSGGGTTTVYPYRQVEPDGTEIEGTWVNIDAKTELTPEPLNTLIFGVNQAMIEFRDRQIAGDQACLVFFDRTTPWFRVVNMTEDFDYLIDFTDFSNNGLSSDEEYTPPDTETQDFDSIKARLVAEGPGTGRQRSIRHGIYPFPSGGTDFRVAFEEAFRQLQNSRDSGVPSAEFVVLITDGLHNCTTESGNQCAFTYSFYRDGMKEIKSLLQDSVVDTGAQVPVHVILSGAHVGPHTRSVSGLSDGASPPNTKAPFGNIQEACFTDEEYRESIDGQTLGFIVGQTFEDDEEGEEAFINMSEETPFYQANADMYEIAVVTRGVFGVLRQRDAGLCAQAGVPVGGSIDPGQYRGLCGSAYSDEAGRITVDPFCRTQSEQIEQYMEKIVGENPYRVVSVN